MVLRVHIHKDEILGPNARTAAIEFCPQGPKFPKIVRAEILQEWAARVEQGQEVLIEDDTYAGAQWTGKVKLVADWFAPKRRVILSP